MCWYNNWKKKMEAILNKFTVLYLSSYVVYFFKLELILFYNRVVYYYSKIFLILLAQIKIEIYPFGWGRRIHRLLLSWGVKHHQNEYPGYDHKLSDGEVSVLELWGMWSTSSLPLLPYPIRFGEVASDSVPSMCLIGLFESLSVSVVYSAVSLWTTRNTYI